MCVFLSPCTCLFLYLSTQMFMVMALHEHISERTHTHTQGNAAALHSRASSPCLRDDLDDFSFPFLSSGPYTVQKWMSFPPVHVPHNSAKMVSVQRCSLVIPEPRSIPAVPQRPQSQNTNLHIKLVLVRVATQTSLNIIKIMNS